MRGINVMKKNKIIYSVAQQELGRDLTDPELRIVEDKIGDQFDWYEAIASVLAMHIELEPTKLGVIAGRS
jgi:hypothetical protein